MSQSARGNNTHFLFHFGFVGQIDEIVHRIKAEMKQEMRVIATGGLAHMISRESKTIDKVDNFLTLTGLRVLYERNIPVSKE